MTVARGSDLGQTTTEDPARRLRFSQLRGSSLTPSIASYDAALEALHRGLQAQKALKLFGELQRERLETWKARPAHRPIVWERWKDQGREIDNLGEDLPLTTLLLRLKGSQTASFWFTGS